MKKKNGRCGGRWYPKKKKVRSEEVNNADLLVSGLEHPAELNSSGLN